MPSADGKGRTLLDILTGRNKKDLTPLELQYHNPLGCRVGSVICCDENYVSGVNFTVEKISVYKTDLSRQTFWHTDYHLKGVRLGDDKYLRMRLRLIADDNVVNELGHQIQLLEAFKESGWDKGLYQLLCENGDYDTEYDSDDFPSFKLWENYNGEQLETPYQYWRIENVPDPYKSQCTVLQDTDGDGTVEDEELEHFPVTSWDFSRLTEDENGLEIIEYLNVEMDDENRYFTFLRGNDVKAFQITVF